MTRSFEHTPSETSDNLIYDYILSCVCVCVCLSHFLLLEDRKTDFELNNLDL